MSGAGMADALGLEVWLKQDAPIPLDIRLSCAPGESLALVGPSGGGKTTILRAIAGLTRPREGLVRCGDEVWLDTSAGFFAPPYRRRAGLVFQSYALFPHMNALANVAAALGHLPRAIRRERAAELLASVHLQGLEQRRPSAFSSPAPSPEFVPGAAVEARRVLGGLHHDYRLAA